MLFFFLQHHGEKEKKVKFPNLSERSSSECQRIDFDHISVPFGCLTPNTALRARGLESLGAPSVLSESLGTPRGWVTSLVCNQIDEVMWGQEEVPLIRTVVRAAKKEGKAGAQPVEVPPRGNTGVGNQCAVKCSLATGSSLHYYPCTSGSVVHTLTGPPTTRLWFQTNTRHHFHQLLTINH